MSDCDIDSLKTKWEQEQQDLRSAFLESDEMSLEDIRIIAGLDISYVKDESNKGCVSLAVLDLDNDFECIYSSCTFLDDIKVPYIAGFLAFREIKFLLKAYQDLEQAIKDSEGKLQQPDLFFIDGNGKLHPRRVGLATHFGITVNRPTVGIAKNPYWMQPEIFGNYTDKRAIKESHKQEIEQRLLHVGDWFPILDPKDQQEVLGAAVRSTEDAKNPIYVSVGHRITLNLAVQTVLKCCKFRIPEPIRKADFMSREFLRNLSSSSSL